MTLVPQAAPSLLRLLVAAFDERGIDLARVGLAWARATPAVTLVPAFGLRALPAAARIVLAVALAAVIFPALPPATTPVGSLWVQIVGEVWRGAPIAVAAAVPLWAATMAGGVADALRGANDVVSAPTVEGSASPMGVTLSLLASCMFFATGGPAHIAAALTRPDPTPLALVHVAEQLADGIAIAVALGAPLLAASVVVEVAGALVARAATPAQLHLVLAPLRALALLSVFALVFDAMSQALAVMVAHPRL